MLYDIIIIGGGPAGITAGIYAARKKMKTLLLAKDFFGQIGKTSEVDNYPGLPKILGPDLAKKFGEHLKSFEIEIKEEEILKISERKNIFSIKTTKDNVFESKTIIIASGADYRKLGVPGEKEFVGKGVSYCPICDAPFFRGKKVAVIGGGNAGFEAALDLLRYAEKIIVFECSEKAKADEFLQELALKSGKIEIFFNKRIKEIKGDEKIRSLEFQDLKSGENYNIPIDGVFVEIGVTAASGFLKGFVKMNKAREIKINHKTCQASRRGIFAAGDVSDGKWRQVAIAVGEGAKAALAAYEYLKTKTKN